MYSSEFRSWFFFLAALRHKCSRLTIKQIQNNWHLQTESHRSQFFFSCLAMTQELEIMSCFILFSQPKPYKVPYIRFIYISAVCMRRLTSDTSFWMKGTIPAMWWKISTCSSSTPWMVKASSYCFSSIIPI